MKETISKILILAYRSHGRSRPCVGFERWQFGRMVGYVLLAAFNFLTMSIIKIVVEANYVLYSIKGGKDMKSSIGFVEFQKKMRDALAIHQQITWALNERRYEDAKLLLLELKKMEEPF